MVSNDGAVPDAPGAKKPGSDAGEAAETAIQPQVKLYRKKDEQRIQQLDELHGELADKVADVIASFQEAPSKTQLIQEALLHKHHSRRRKVKSRRTVKKTPVSLLWLFGLLAVIAIGLLVFGLIAHYR